eukprot:321357-Ditylum_brightwellii.AAC.1
MTRHCKCGVAIEKTNVKHNSDYLSLGLPRELCCDVCVRKVDAGIGMQKKSSAKRRPFVNLVT